MAVVSTPIRLFGDLYRLPMRYSTMRQSMVTLPLRYASDWQGDIYRTAWQSMVMYRTLSTPPPWYGNLPPGTAVILPTYEIRGRVMQRDPVTEEDYALPLIRVALFFRRTNYVVDMQVSDEDGYVTFSNLMPGDQAYYGIAFDAEGAPMQNSVLWDRLTSVPGT